MLRKAMLYLGLGPDEEYEDYEDPQPGPEPDPEPVAPEPDAERRALADNVRALPPTPSPQPRPKGPRTVKPRVVAPTSFNDAQQVADSLKALEPVIMNLQGVDRDLSRRLIDFASGVCYGVGGQMERVAQAVYLMTPTDVEVSDEDRRRLSARGYDA